VGKIQLLADDVINKIAAGEVVERPASVVKELVENALDAGARSIQVELEDGGRKAIAISDDGCGMDEGDALLALKRHATSKIRSVDDLYAAATMGFRGEALASIASVSRLTLTTRERDAATGIRIEASGSDTPQVQRGVAAATGTALACRDLFYNVPARQKFMKSTASELGAVTEFFDAAVLCWPDVRLRLLHNGKEIIASAAAPRETSVCGIGETALRARAAAVFGDEVASKLVYVSEADSHAAVEGLVSPPGLEKATSKSMFTFVNGRWVKDKVLRYAVQRGYHSHLLRGKYPVVALHITVDPSVVDVNVHPAKTEVRFQYGSEVQSVIVRAIMKALRQADWAQPSGMGRGFLPVGSLRVGMTDRHSEAEPKNPLPAFAEPKNPLPAFAEPKNPLPAFAEPKNPLPAFAEPKNPEPVAAAIPWADLAWIGSVGRCYLMFTDGERLLAVDQHAWHERIIFERLSRDRALLHQSQALMIPESIELPAGHCEALQAGHDTLARNGFDLEFTGDTSIEVRAVPAILAHRDPQEMLAAIAETGFGGEVTAEIGQDLLATFACHSAVRAGEELGPDELRRLLREASEVDFQHNCPHGRRVFRWWESSQIARWFDR
jgi:DNA mismatch repair protein MutL